MKKINLETTFWFGKHKGKNFKEVFLNDRNYIFFLFRKGFKFHHNCIGLINENKCVQTEISVKINGNEKNVKVYEKTFIELGKGRVVFGEKFLEKFSIEDIPEKIIERRIERQIFDSSAFQIDDRFFTSVQIVKKRIFDEVELQKRIKEKLKKYKK